MKNRRRVVLRLRAGGKKLPQYFCSENMDAQFGDREFRMFESWLDRISSWADHDGLVHYLISPMVAAKPARVKNVFRWSQVARSAGAAAQSALH